MPVELFHLVCGDRIGQGIAREVYVFKPDPKFVIKFELGAYDFQNVHEWTLWTSAPPHARKWLAPCEDISEHGRILIQRRMDRLVTPPKRVPKWLDDTHADNWGTIKGRPVAVDYGRHHLLSRLFKGGLVRNRHT